MEEDFLKFKNYMHSVEYEKEQKIEEHIETKAQSAELDTEIDRLNELIEAEENEVGSL